MPLAIKALPAVVEEDGSLIAMQSGFKEQERFWFTIKKTDSHISKLLQVPFKIKGSTEHTLSRSDIVEQLTVLRNKLHQTSSDPAAGPEVKKESLPLELQARVIVQIKCPSIGDVEGLTMAVLARAAHEPLCVEATAANVEYLRRVVKYQVEAGNVKIEPRFTAAQKEARRLSGGSSAVEGAEVSPNAASSEKKGKKRSCRRSPATSQLRSRRKRASEATDGD